MHPSVKTCECGHAQVEHQSGGAHGLHEIQYGICLSYGCPCLRFHVAEQVTEEAA